MAESESLSPVMMRVYKDDKKGATAFFRNIPFLETVIAAFKQLPKIPVEVFFHASSVGAEPYSFAAYTLENDLTVTIDASDIEPAFIEAARKGVYPIKVLEQMTEAQKKWFRREGEGAVIDEALKDKVHFQRPQSLMEPLQKTYDAVFAMNVLTYLTPAQQSEAIATLAARCRSYLCVTAFHPDTIKADIESAGFEPVPDHQERIHNAWGDRVHSGPISPDSPAYSWKVPPYNTDAHDYAWRYCAIFKRKDL